MHITLRQIQVFTVIAQQQNMTTAAEILHLSQSACSMALTSLETQLGIKLFYRHAKRLILNEYGRFLLPKALNLLGQANDIEDSVKITSTGRLVGHLMIGASSTIGNYLLPAIIGRFMVDHPQVKISLQVSNSEQVIQQLLEFKLDMGFIEGTCYTPNLNVVRWGKDELVIIAAPQHPLAKRKTLKKADIQSARWILRELGSGTRERVEIALGGYILDPFLELGHTEAIKNAVRQGLGISCLSRLTVANDLNNRELVELPVCGIGLERNFYYLLSKHAKPSILLQNFLHSVISNP